MQDLRIHDNPALCEAVRTANLLGGVVTLLYVHSPEEVRRRRALAMSSDSGCMKQGCTDCCPPECLVPHFKPNDLTPAPGTAKYFA